MYILSENLKQFEGKTVKVNVCHKIYGNQQLKIRNFQPLCSDDKAGVVVDGREVFLYLSEIENVIMNKNTLQIIGDVRAITIQKI